MGSAYVMTSGKITLAASATKSLILLSPAASTSIRIIGMSVSMDASSLEAGVQLDLYRVVTLGTPAGSSTLVPQPMYEETTPATANTTALYNLTTEPTTVTVLESWYVQPVGGLLVVQLPLGREYGAKAGGAHLGIRATTAAGVTPDVVANIQFEE